jgi:hypothetical protein
MERKKIKYPESPQPYGFPEPVMYVSVEWKTYQRLKDQVEEVLTKSRKLRTDRDALLEACQQCLRQTDDIDDLTGVEKNIRKFLKAAIAQAKKED